MNTKKNTAASGKLIKAVYDLYVCVYMLCAVQSGRLEYNIVVIGKMVREEGVCVVCVCISYIGDGGQPWSSFLRSGRGDQGGQGNCRKVFLLRPWYLPDLPDIEPQLLLNLFVPEAERLLTVYPRDKHYSLFQTNKTRHTNNFIKCIHNNPTLLPKINNNSTQLQTAGQLSRYSD